jgi:hypothetical protein
MKSAAPLLFVLAGILLLYLGVTGRLGLFLAAIFTPEEVQ